MPRNPLIVILLMPLAACGAATEPQPTANVATTDDYAVRIRALPERQRGAVLLRAIRDAGRECQHVVQSAAVGDSDGAPAWTARCDDGATWIVALNPGGVATVTGAVDGGKGR